MEQDVGERQREGKAGGEKEGMRQQIWLNKKKRISNFEVLIKFNIGNYSNTSTAERCLLETGFCFCFVF